MQFNTFTINLANKYKMRPVDIAVIEIAYDFIGRFSFIANKEELDACVMEERNGKEYVYRDVPSSVKRIVADSLEKYGAYSISNFYSPFMKPVKFELFLKNMIEKQIQPSTMFERGVTTYKNLMHPNSKNLCAEVVKYAS